MARARMTDCKVVSLQQLKHPLQQTEKRERSGIMESNQDSTTFSSGFTLFVSLSFPFLASCDTIHLP